MPTVNIIRAWKDEEYRLSLSDQQQSLLPQHPAGTIELSNEDIIADHPACTVTSSQSPEQLLLETDLFAV